MPTDFIDQLEVSVRAGNFLKQAGVTTMEEFIALDLDKHLKETDNFGRRTYNELKEQIAQLVNPPVWRRHEIFTLQVDAEQGDQAVAVQKALTTIGREMRRLGYAATLSVDRSGPGLAYEEISTTPDLTGAITKK